MVDLKERQEKLRHNVLFAVNSYIDNSDDIKNGMLAIDNKTQQVSIVSCSDCNEDCAYSYYRVIDLIVPSRLWFTPEYVAINAVVQELLPNPYVKDVVDAAYSEIENFLATTKPQHIRTCGISIGTRTCTVDCFDEQSPEKVEMTAEELAEMEDTLDDDNLWEDADTIPMHKIVSKTEHGYVISKFNLTMTILNYLDITDEQ
jgi:hypothetical protein